MIKRGNYGKNSDLYFQYNSKNHANIGPKYMLNRWLGIKERCFNESHVSYHRYTCRCLPNSQLHKEIMLKPGRYAKVHESAKQIRQKLGRKLRKILGARIEIPHEFARLHPTYKTHKQFPNIPMRPVTPYYNRGLAIPQRMLSRVLTEVENFHCFNPKQKQHVLRSSVEFTMLLPETFQQAHTADVCSSTVYSFPFWLYC